MRIAIITPARPGTRNGNLHTATRWASMLRGAGFAVRVLQSWDGRPADLLIALHARRSHESAARWKAAHPDRPLIVTLTGTDLYRDLPACAQARRSLALADVLVTLQHDALARLGRRFRKKAQVVYQSSGTRLRQAAPGRTFRVAVVGHLREEKDPFRAVGAVALLGHHDIEVVHVGGALDPAHERAARRWEKREPRYRWLGSVPHEKALRWIASSHVLVVSSRMEGGANVISEAARIGTPVIASRMSGNLGMLGRSYPGYFRTGSTRGLARRLARAQNDAAFYGSLRTAIEDLRPRFAPAEERRSLLGAVRAALRRRPASRGWRTSENPDRADRAFPRPTRR